MPAIDRSKTEWHKSSASKAWDPGRHHLVTPGDIISECLGDFIGIRIDDYQQAADARLARTKPASSKRLLKA